MTTTTNITANNPVPFTDMELKFDVVVVAESHPQDKCTPRAKTSVISGTMLFSLFDPNSKNSVCTFCNMVLAANLKLA